MIDVLGFKELLNKMQRSVDSSIFDRTWAVLQQPQALVEAWRARPGDESEGLEALGLRGFDEASRSIQVIGFSDTVIATISLKYGIEAAFVSAALLFSAVQFFFSELECPIRGGIARGPVRHQGMTILGPAVAKAYVLESTVAVVPRLVVDRVLVQQLGTIGSSYVSRDADGQYYIQPFLFCVAPQDQPKLSMMRPMIANGLAEAFAAESPALESKYLWLARQFNLALIDIKSKGLTHTGIEPIAVLGK